MAVVAATSVGCKNKSAPPPQVFEESESESDETGAPGAVDNAAAPAPTRQRVPVATPTPKPEPPPGAPRNKPVLTEEQKKVKAVKDAEEAKRGRFDTELGQQLSAARPKVKACSDLAPQPVMVEVHYRIRSDGKTLVTDTKCPDDATRPACDCLGKVVAEMTFSPEHVADHFIPFQLQGKPASP